MNPITIDEGRAQLTQIADARRSRSLTGRQTLAQFEQARQDFIRAQSETNRSVQSRIETVDEQGNITTEILPGVPNGLRSGSQLISTNVRSLRGRIRAVRSAEFQLDKIITSIRRNQWDEVPRDPPAFLESLVEHSTRR